MTKIMLTSALEGIRSNQKQLFFIDGIGALFSAFSLGIVLVNFEHVFGIPASTLYILALFPCFFAAFDFICYRRANIKMNLRIIALMNLFYCLFSLVMASFHSDQITFYGWLYLVLEIALILALVKLEFKVARTLTHE